MDDDAKLRLMQKRIIKSYAWQRDVIVPLSKEFDCTVDELEDVFFDLFDMDSLGNLHGTFKSAEDICLYQKLNADLRLCWFSGTLEVISKEDAKELKCTLEESKLKEALLQFELVRLNGRYNMVQDFRARLLVGISKEDYIIKHYSELIAKYMDVKAKA